MRAQQLPMSRGLRWIGEAFVVFRAAPLRLLLLDLVFLLALGFVVALPVIGFAVVWLLVPAMVVGPHALSRAAARGAGPDWDMLVSGFRGNLAGQMRLGGVYLGVMALVLAASALADGGRFAQAMIGRVPLQVAELQEPALQSAMMIGAALQTALLTLLWYAPLLVAWDRVPAAKAVFFSAAAVLINWRAFLAYGIGMTLLFAMVLMLALGGALLLGGPKALQGGSPLFAVVWTLLPIWFASSYLSYRDVFGAGEAPAPSAPPAGEA